MEVNVDFICSKLEDWFGNPCDFNFVDCDAEHVLTDINWCEENCDCIPHKECWKELFRHLASTSTS